MKKFNRHISLFLVMIIFIIFISSSISKAYEQREIFNSIIDKTHGKIVECGVVSSYNTYTNKKNQLENMLDKIGIGYNDYKLVKNDSRTYFIQFENDKLIGYIEKINQNGYYSNILNIRLKRNKTDLLLLNNIAKKVKNNAGYKVCKYIKAKIDDDNLYKLNSSIIENLKEKDIYNIESISISNGYSTTAYTTKFNNFKEIYNDNRNLNYALCRYYSGNYIIIATPEIPISY